jgi:hypothetical protein
VDDLIERTTDMIATSRLGTRITRFLAVAFPLLLAGCTSAYSGPEGMRVVVRPNAIYMVVPGPVAARATCVAAGMRTPGLDGPMLTASAQGLTVTDGGTGAAGCQGLVRSVIVCSTGDDRCLRHEERHAREGAFHP